MRNSIGERARFVHNGGGLDRKRVQLSLNLTQVRQGLLPLVVLQLDRLIVSRLPQLVQLLLISAPLDSRFNRRMYI